MSIQRTVKIFTRKGLWAALVLAMGVWMLNAVQPARGQTGIAITPDFPALPSAVVGTAWSQVFTASGGTAPYTWDSSGTINGLTFDPDTATLSGTPIRVGSFAYTISVTDADDLTGSISTGGFIVHANTTTQITAVTSGRPDGQLMVGYPVWVDVSVNESALGTPEPTGEVEVSGGGESCRAALDANQDGRCALIFDTAGAITLSASYLGDTYFLTSTSSNYPLTILPLNVSAAISSGGYHTCYQNSQGMLECWGAVRKIPNDGGDPPQPSTVGPASKISAGGHHVCALNTDGTISCWGDNIAVTGFVPTGKYIDLSSGRDFVCAIDTASRLHCWGELGTGLSAVPTVRVTQVSAGWTHACAIRQSNQEVVCWGDPVGDSKLTAPANTSFRALAAGRYHTCGIRTNGTVACWGTLSGTPPAGNTFVEIGSGSDFTCARNSANAVSCWGSGSAVTELNSAGTYQALGVGAFHACGLQPRTPSGYYLACWGSTVFGQAPRLSLSPVSISPNLPLNRPFSQLFTADGGALPYTLSVSSGSLPSNLSIANLELSGTPNVVGNYSPTLRLVENYSASALPLELAPVARGYPMAVQPSWTTIGIDSVTPGSAMVGTPVEVAVSVQKDAGSTPLLSGSVEVTTGDPNTSCQAAVESDGSAECTLFFVTPGPFSISAEYLGDAFYVGSTSTTSASHTATPAVLTPMVSAGNQFSCAINGNGIPTCWGKNDSGQSTPPAGTFRKLSAGGFTTCGVGVDSRITCWGANTFGVAAPPSYFGFQTVAVGTTHACGLLYTGQLSCWGSTSNQMLNIPTLSWLDYWTDVTAGDDHSCGLVNDGSGRCWGLSDNNRTNIPAALQLPGALKAISAGGVFSCAIRADDTLVCWGGDGTSAASIVSPPAGPFKAVDAGRYHACALRSDDQVVCWGSNASGQVGPAAAGYGSFSAVSAGADHTCALRLSDQSLECWGANAQGQAPILSLLPVSPLPTIDPGVEWTRQMQASGGRMTGYFYSWPPSLTPAGLALDSQTGLISGTPTEPGLYQFSITIREDGISPFFSLSQNYAMTVRSPVAVTAAPVLAGDGMVGVPVRVNVQVAEDNGGDPPVMGAVPSGMVTVTADDGRTCQFSLQAGQGSCDLYFLTPGQKSLAVFYPGDGLFLRKTENLPSFNVNLFQQAEQINTGKSQTFVHRSDGSVVCLGDGCGMLSFNHIYPDFGVGQDLVCGLETNGSAACSAAGVLAQYPGPFKSLAVGRGHACGINSYGQVTCWGDNTSGQAVPTAGNYRQISAGGSHTCGLNLTGMPVCWGADDFGQSSPVGGPYLEISAGGAHTCALNAAGAVTCWGDNASGQSTSPGGVYVSVAASGQHTCALNSSGTAVCWGNNASGQTAGPMGTFTTLDADDNHSCALRVGPKITCWGGNESGEAPQIDILPLTSSTTPALLYWEHFFLPTGATKPFFGSLTSGALPPGINMAFSPAGLVLYGTPSVPGNYSMGMAWESSDLIPVVREDVTSLTITGTDLRLTIQSAPAAQALYKNSFYWDFTVTNQASLDLPGAEIDITFPVTLTGAQVSGLAGCVLADQTFTCPTGPIAAGASVTVRLEGILDNGLGGLLEVNGETWPTTAGWPEVAETDNRAVNSIIVFVFKLFLPSLWR